MLRPQAWGIDLTGGVLRAVRVQRRPRRFHILDAVQIPYSGSGEGAQRLHVHLPRAARQALHTFLQEQAGTLADPVFVGIHGYGGEQGAIAVPDAGVERQEELLEYELRSRVRTPVEGLVVRAGGGGRTGRHKLRQVHWVAMRRRVVEPFLRDLRDVGCPVDGLVPEPVALRRYLDVEWPGVGRRLVLHVQRTRTDLLYLTDEGLRFRSLPLGVGGLTGFVAGSRTPPRPEVDALVRRIHKEHEQALAFFFGDRHNFPVDRLLLIGDGDSLPSLHQAVGEAFGLAPERVHHQRWFTVSSRLQSGAALDLNQMGVALGLAIGALRRGGEEFSLVPPPPDRRIARLRPALSLSMLAVAASLLSLHLLTVHERTRLREQQASLAQEEAWAAQDKADALAQRVAEAAEGREELAGMARGLARQVGVPRRLLDAVAGPTSFFRLVELELTAAGAGDRLRCVVEVPNGLPGAVAQVRQWMGDEMDLREIEARSLDDTEDGLLVEVTGRRRGALP